MLNSILLVTTEGSHGRIRKACQNIDSCELKPALKSCHFLNTTTTCTNTHVHFYGGLVAVFGACVQLLIKILPSYQLILFVESGIQEYDRLDRELIIWKICENDNMEYLDCLGLFPRLDYDVRGGQGAADWPTPSNSWCPLLLLPCQNCFLPQQCSLKHVQHLQLCFEIKQQTKHLMR